MAANFTIYTSDTPTNTIYQHGMNLRWCYDGDVFDLVEDTKKLKAYKTSIIRVPGGIEADVYNWKNGVDPKQPNILADINQSPQTSRIGIDEWIGLNIPLMFTVNIYDPSSIVDLIKRIRSKTNLPLYIELGNEPYLKNEVRKSLNFNSTQYVDMVRKILSVLIENFAPLGGNLPFYIGIPLRSDDMAGTPITPYQGWNKAVLTGLKSYKQFINFFSIHTAYLPFATSNKLSKGDLLNVLYNSPRMFMNDYYKTLADLSTYFGGSNYPICLSEYAPYYANDPYVLDSFYGALYTMLLNITIINSKQYIIPIFWSYPGNYCFNAKKYPFVFQFLSDFMYPNTVVQPSVIENGPNKVTRINNIGTSFVMAGSGPAIYVATVKSGPGYISYVLNCNGISQVIDLRSLLSSITSISGEQVNVNQTIPQNINFSKTASGYRFTAVPYSINSIRYV